jgi:hypothetical protein
MAIHYEKCPYCRKSDGTKAYKCNECSEVFCDRCFATKSALSDPFNYGAKFCPVCKSDRQNIDWNFGVID